MSKHWDYEDDHDWDDDIDYAAMGYVYWYGKYYPNSIDVLLWPCILMVYKIFWRANEWKVLQRDILFLKRIQEAILPPLWEMPMFMMWQML